MSPFILGNFGKPAAVRKAPALDARTLVEVRPGVPEPVAKTADYRARADL